VSFATGLVSVTAASIIDAVQWVQGLRQSTACRVPVYEALKCALKLSSVCIRVFILVVFLSLVFY